MTEFENIVIGKSSISSLIITVDLMIVTPVVFLSIGAGNIKSRQISAI